jgi:hypothetical protein
MFVLGFALFDAAVLRSMDWAIDWLDGIAMAVTVPMIRAVNTSLVLMLASIGYAQSCESMRSQAHAPRASRMACATFVACDTRPTFAPETIFRRRVLARGAMPSLEVIPAEG